MSSRSLMDRAPARCSGGHGFDSCRGLRIFLCPTLVSCWLIHLHISLPSLKFIIFINLSQIKFVLNLVLKAYQTFEALCKIGSKHDLSAGHIIGGEVQLISDSRLGKPVNPRTGGGEETWNYILDKTTLGNLPLRNLHLNNLF